ncbi:MAG: hypothetical protein PHF25_00940 [Candidatus Margulisbacteria bacterium]|nr:hypothetical protein [Candidatus Margulisiibacteriota bacterium]
MIETITNTELQKKIYYPAVRIIEDIIPFVFDISVLVRAKFNEGVNSFIQNDKRIDVIPYGKGFRGWIADAEKGSFPVIYSDTECVDLYPGWNLLIIKNKDIEMFVNNRFFVDSKGQFLDITIIKENKAFLDTNNSNIFKSAWVMVKKGVDLLSLDIRNKYLDNNFVFTLESQEKVMIILGDKGRGYYRYAFIKEAINNNFWIYSFASFDDLGYKLDEKKRCITDICPECYVRPRAQFVIFDDPLVTCIIKHQLEISGRGLFSSDLLLLKELDLEDYKLHSINGLDQCLGLQVLKIRGFYVSGLSEIVFSLPSLKKIYLSKELYSAEELKVLASFL